MLRLADLSLIAVPVRRSDTELETKRRVVSVRR